MSGDIFEQPPFGVCFAEDAGNIGPQVPFVVFSLSLPCGAEWLARISGKHDVDAPAIGPPVKAGDVVPDRRGPEHAASLSCDEGRPGMLVPLDETSRVKSWLGEHEAKIKTTGSGAQRYSVDWPPGRATLSCGGM